MPFPIKIALIDDQQLFRGMLATALALETNMEVILEAESGHAFLTVIQNRLERPDIAIIDMFMPHMNGLQLTDIIHNRYPEIKIIILSIDYRERLIAKAVDTGASAYLNKNCDLSTLKTAIEGVYHTGFYMDTSTLKALRDSSIRIEKTIVEDHLTKRENEILSLICQEFTNAEIAEKLFLSTRTVEGHRNNLLLKTGCKNTAGLVIYAIKHGVFDLLI
ncbi:response regulator transcription factor [Olivibacter sp. CPCC 100613]|uniref:response regulator transcription factor n=1 Tax=Olivibacter sp. CPCC 100613 TaxID=3079931 RepID=UPI002FFA979A